MNWRLLFVSLSRVFVLNAVVAKHTLPHAAKTSNEKFALELSATAGLAASAQNVLVSPLLLQAAIALLYFGAADDTATLLKDSLHLQRFVNKQAACVNVAELLSSTKFKVGTEAKWASAYYVQKHLMFKFQADFEQMAQQLNISTNVVDFSENSLHEINNWFLAQTRYGVGDVFYTHVKEVSSPFVLVSSLVFQAPWAVGFDVKDTEKLNFYGDVRNHKRVDSMFLTHDFQYAELSRLEAKAIEMPFENSNLKMLILLPNHVDGLRALEEKIKYADFSAIVEQLSVKKLALTLPKFRIEYNTDLKEVFGFLGIGDIFKSESKFPNIFSSFMNVRSPHVTSVQHKAVFTVDESGGPNQEGFSLGGLFHRPTQVVIDHPFYFAIRTDEAVLLAGHIVNP